MYTKSHTGAPLRGAPVYMGEYAPVDTALHREGISGYNRSS